MRCGDWLRGLRSGWIRASSRPRVRRGVCAAECLEPRLVLVEDFGDAPDTGAGTGTGNYRTLLSDDGPRHTIVADLFLGAGVDGEPDGLPDAAANGDDNSGTDDEDGVVNPLVSLALKTGRQASVTVRATNLRQDANAVIWGFIDFNQDGHFSEINERAGALVSTGTNNGTFTLTFPVVPLGSQGNTWARFRLGQDSQSSLQGGLSASGEVEDYPVTIVAEDWGDAPDTAAGTGTGNYRTLLSDDGPRHTIVAGLFMGARVDDEGDGQPNAQANGDDSNPGGGPDDEDGVVNPLVDLTLTAGFPATATLRATNTTGTDATLSGFIDFNRNGEFSEINERAQIVVPAGTNNGTFVLNFGMVPAGSKGSTYARFRLGQDAQSATQGGLSASGEVEDYAVTMVAEDFGDAPFGTSLSIGARHTIVPGLSMGARVDGELNGQPNVRANGDDSNSLSGGPDDEDGVVNPQVDLVLTTGTQPTVTLRATNTTGTAATLTGFIDFNNDGFFSDFNERAQVTVPTGTNNGTFTLTFPIIPTGSEGKTYARFRLGQDAQSGFQQGLSASGEVEDYTVTITGPTDSTVKTGGATKLANGGTNVPALLDNDRFGRAVANLGDLDGDGVADIAVGAPLDGTGGPSRGAVHILFLNADGSVKSSSTLEHGGTNMPTLADFDGFGFSLTNMGDLNGDGVADLAVGAPGDNTGGVGRGAVHILFLNANGTVKSNSTLESGGTNMPVLADRNYFGRSVANLGDVDGDGVADLAVGASGDSTGGVIRGAVHILFLNANGTVKSSGATKIAHALNGGPTLADADFFGASVTNLGDLDGDGVADLAVGSYRDNTGASDAGAVYILFLNATGASKSTTKIASGMNGGPTLAEEDRFGSSVAFVGDVDGDGVADLAVGAINDNTNGPERGAIHILALNTSGTVKTSRKIASGTNGGPTLANGDAFGDSVTNLGDLDGDGGTDLLVGASRDSTVGANRGAVHILRLKKVGEFRDFGDAPDASNGTGAGNYQTRNADGGPSHSLDSGMLLGTRISGEPDALANSRANGDDIGNDDEDGVVNPQVDLQLTVLTQPTVTLRATNTAGNVTTATLTGWIDYNNNGVFETTERAQTLVSFSLTPNRTFTLTFPVIPQGFTGTTYARFRIGQDVASESPTGAAGRGEVEDYVVTITAPSTGGVKTGGVTKLASGGTNMPTLTDNDYFGGAVANLGDLDGDGVADLAVGALGDDTNGDYRGAVHILFLNANGTVKSRSKIADGTGGGPTLADDDSFGSSVANLGDLDGDGVTDLAVGTPGDDTNGGVRGAVYLLFLNTNGTVKSSTKIASDTGGGPTLLDGGRFGSSVASMGDLNGDGVTDLAVGALNDGTGGATRGAVYVLFLNSSGTVTGNTKLADGETNMPVLADVDRFGSSVANVGDLDGDDVADLAVGARGDDTGGPLEGGAVYILLLNSTGTVKVNGAKKIANGVGGGPVLVADSYFGSSLANVGDLDGDGVADLAVGAMRDDTQGANRGAVHVLFLNAGVNAGTAKSSVKLASGIPNGPTLADGDHFGSGVANLGDFDGDGVTDLAIGAYRDAAGDTGAVHILRLAAANQAPTGLDLSANPSAENAAVDTVIGTFTTTDAASTFTYTLVTGTGSDDNGSFTISGNQLRSAASFNFELRTSFSIRVRTTDAGGLFFERSFTINITNVNETPIGLGLSNTTILETIANGAAVGNLSTTDPDVGNTFTYTFVAGTGSTDNGSFSIVGSQLRTNTNVDNDNRNNYQVRIRTTDQGGLFAENTFTITVTNVNEAPTALNLSASSIAENLPSGTAIGTFSSTDPDTSNTFAYSLVAGAGATDNASFTIVGTQLRSNAVLNFEAKPSLSIRVRTTDQSNLFFERTFTITVTNVNEAPVLDNSGNIFAVLGVGSRQSAEMRKGVLVSDLLARGAGGNPISDPDTGALRGIAITAVDQSLGSFQVTGVPEPIEQSWVNIDTDGPLSESRALLLSPNARIRFVTGRIPHHASAPFFLSVGSMLTAGLTFRAWDQATGVDGVRVDTTVNGGSTAFSTATETVKVYFEVRLFRSFNPNASLNVYTLEAEFNALTGGAFQDRSTDAFTGFTVLLSDVPELGTSALFRLYFGIQFNDDGTETDMGYRYLTSNAAEATFLEGIGPAAKRPQREGTYFRELGVSNGTATIGYVFNTQQPGTSQLTQIYRTDNVNKPTRPPGTSEGGTPTSFKPQENGDHVYTTNTAFETTQFGTWRVESPRGFVRPLGGSGIIAPATPAGATSAPVVRSATTNTVGPMTNLFIAGDPGSIVSVILPTTLATTSAVLNPDHVSTTVAVGLIALPAPATQPTLVDDPAKPETTEPIPEVTSELVEDWSATDDLFASLGSTADDLRPW